MLKKILYILILIVVLFPFTYNNGQKIENYLDNVYVYTGSNGSNAKMQKIENNKEKDIYGTSGTLKKDIAIEDIIQNFSAKLVFTEQIAGVTNYYYSCNLPRKISLYGEEISLHIAVGEKIVVGTPIIFGGY